MKDTFLNFSLTNFGRGSKCGGSAVYVMVGASESHQLDLGALGASRVHAGGHKLVLGLFERVVGAAVDLPERLKVTLRSRVNVAVVRVRREGDDIICVAVHLHVVCAGVARRAGATSDAARRRAMKSNIYNHQPR